MKSAPPPFSTNDRTALPMAGVIHGSERAAISGTGGSVTILLCPWLHHPALLCGLPRPFGQLIPPRRVIRIRDFDRCAQFSSVTSSLKSTTTPLSRPSVLPTPRPQRSPPREPVADERESRRLSRLCRPAGADKCEPAERQSRGQPRQGDPPERVAAGHPPDSVLLLVHGMPPPCGWFGREYTVSARADGGYQADMADEVNVFMAMAAAAIDR